MRMRGKPEVLDTSRGKQTGVCGRVSGGNRGSVTPLLSSTCSKRPASVTHQCKSSGDELLRFARVNHRVTRHAPMAPCSFTVTSEGQDTLPVFPLNPPPPSPCTPYLRSSSPPLPLARLLAPLSATLSLPALESVSALLPLFLMALSSPLWRILGQALCRAVH